MENKKVSRKKFLAWSAGISSLLVIPAFLKFSGKKNEPGTVKMLTQDGRLVEINKNMIPGRKSKITDPELKAWIKK
jgi:hypothetical protein